MHATQTINKTPTRYHQAVALQHRTSRSSPTHRFSNSRSIPNIATATFHPIAKTAETPAWITTAPDGRQYDCNHGQRRVKETNREHEVPGFNGTLAPLQKHRRVSTLCMFLMVFQLISGIFLMNSICLGYWASRRSAVSVLQAVFAYTYPLIGGKCSVHGVVW